MDIAKIYFKLKDIMNTQPQDLHLGSDSAQVLRVVWDLAFIVHQLNNQILSLEKQLKEKCG